MLQQKSAAAIAVGRWDAQKSGEPCPEHGFNHSGVKEAFVKSWAGHIMLHLLLLLLRSAVAVRLS